MHRETFYTLALAIMLAVYLSLRLSQSEAELHACRMGANDAALEEVEMYLAQHPTVEVED